MRPNTSRFPHLQTECMVVAVTLQASENGHVRSALRTLLGSCLTAEHRILQVGQKTKRKAPYATAAALPRASAAMTAATIAAGLLTTSTYQAIYTPYVSSSDRTEIASSPVDQTGNPVVTAADADYAFRLLNAISFASSLMCIAFATFVLWQIAARQTYRPSLFKLSFLGLMIALVTSAGAALVSVFVFVDRTSGIVGAVFVSVAIVALFLGFCGCISVNPDQGKPAKRPSSSGALMEGGRQPTTLTPTAAPYTVTMPAGSLRETQAGSGAPP